ncbi:MAG TPA: PorV/PorQ family protein [Longimicrobiales bacterium]|nr:PorV/PorQ family protein [Longimicrobiales bacterium]
MLRGKYLTTAFAAAALLVAGSGEVAAQDDVDPNESVDNIAYGTRAGEFLLVPVGARASAMGQAASAFADDATALYWNPANAGFAADRVNIHFTHYDYLLDTSYSWGGVTFPMAGGDWVIGLQVGGFSFDEELETTLAEPEGTGSTFSNSMFVGGLTTAFNVTDRFSFGATGKFVQESLADTKGSTLAVDLGTNFHTTVADRSLRASFAILNLGGEIEHSGSDLEITVPNENPNEPQRQDRAELRTQPFPLPVMFKIGLAYDAVSTPTNRLMLAGEFWQPQQNNTSAAFGAEYTIMPEGVPGFSASLRGGYTYEPDRTFDETAATDLSFDDDGTDGLSAGGGVSWRPSDSDGLGFSLDYAYRHLGLLSGTNMFSVSLNF